MSRSPWISAHGRSSGCAKPVVGLAGGIGSGKSFIAQIFADLGCGVIRSDADAHAVLDDLEVQHVLVAWWGEGIVRHPAGDAARREVDRKAVAARVFGHPEELARLNALVHPRVAELRHKQMARFLADAGIPVIIWDTPLLFEVGLDRQCDAVVFVKAAVDRRLERVSQSRGWSAVELAKRENSQFPLDKKLDLADYVLDNSGDAVAAQSQVREVFSLILSRSHSGLPGKVAPA